MTKRQDHRLSEPVSKEAQMTFACFLADDRGAAVESIPGTDADCDFRQDLARLATRLRRSGRSVG